MNINKEEKCVVNVRPDLRWAARHGNPSWRGDGAMDHGRKLVCNRLSVGLEHFGLNLGKSIPNLFGFFGEFYGEVGFELVDELGYNL